VRARLILDGEDRVAGVTGLLSDVTERKRSQRDALAEQRVIRALAEASSEEEALRAGV